MAITFALSAVEPDREPLDDASLAGNLKAYGVNRVVAADAGDARLVSALPLNGLVVAMHVACTRHRPLTLTPDAVWLCIA